MPQMLNRSSVQASLNRLDLLAPGIMRELRAAWSDPDLAGRLLEELLGGQRGVELQTEALIELVQLYQHLECQRVEHAIERRSASRTADRQHPMDGPAGAN